MTTTETTGSADLLVRACVETYKGVPPPEAIAFCANLTGWTPQRTLAFAQVSASQRLSTNITPPPQSADATDPISNQVPHKITGAAAKRKRESYPQSTPRQKCKEEAPPCPKSTPRQKRGEEIRLVVPADRVHCVNLEKYLARYPDFELVPQQRKCYDKKYAKFEKCRGCITRQVGDTCRFKGLRVFLDHPTEDTIHPIPAYYSTKSTNSTEHWTPILSDDVLASHYPQNFSISQHIKQHTASTILPIIQEELEHARAPNSVHCERVSGRQLCDMCRTTVFNVFWMCSRCAAEICSQCYSGKIQPGNKLCSYKRPHLSSDFVPLYYIAIEDLERVAAKVQETVATLCQAESQVQHPLSPPTGELSENDGYLNATYLRMQANTASLEEFQAAWGRGEIVVVEGIQMNEDWTGKFFSEVFGKEIVEVVNCSNFQEVKMSVKDFFDCFDDPEKRPLDNKGNPLVLKLKDWPSDSRFSDKFGQHYNDFMKALPFPQYTTTTGGLNLVGYLPGSYIPPDLGPKMYNAFATSEESERGIPIGTTCLHMDMADAVNLMMHVGTKPSTTKRSSKSATAKSSTAKADGGTDANIGAIWDVFSSKDLPKLKQYLTELVECEGLKKIKHPIHDQSIYLSDQHLEDLWKHHGVRSWRFHQRPGDAIFIPAGSPHQVANTRSAIKVAMDFVSPEHVGRSAELTEEFRLLPANHRRRQDLLQLKNILWSAWRASMDRE